ncbi:MAG: helix-turn-helix transcriptional regulator [Betaproteobacteria bacterium]
MSRATRRVNAGARGSWTPPPVQLTPFIGRRSELAAIRDRLRQGRWITLVGPGGVGKSRLAMHVAGQTDDQYPGGVHWIDLSRLPPKGLVADEVGRSLAVPQVTEVSGPVEAVVESVGDQCCLIILDNCEHVLTGVAQLVPALLIGCPRLTVLATSRERVAADAETVWQVPPLSLPRSGLGIEALTDFDASKLFIERARATRADFQVDRHNAEAIVGLCIGLDGLPLGIELAAAQVMALSPEQIVRAIDEIPDLLSRRHTGMPERHRTMRSSVEWSHDLLNRDEQKLFRRLAMFVGGFSMGAVADVCTDDELDPGRAMELLTRLVNKSLVVAEPSGAEYRYRMLDTVRRHATDRLAESGEDAYICDRHMRYFLALAERAAPRLEAEASADLVETLDRDWHNLRAAMDTAISGEPDTTALRLANALTVFFVIRSHFVEGRRCLAGALAASDPAPSLERCRALWGMAHMAHLLADRAGVAEYAAAADEMAAVVGDRITAGRAKATLGTLHMLDNPPLARTLFQDSENAARESGDDWCLALSRQYAAMAWTAQGEVQRARMARSRSYEVVERLGNRYFQAWHWLGVAIVAVLTAELDEAGTATLRAGELAGQVGDPVCGAWAAHSYVDVLCLRGAADRSKAVLSDLAMVHGLRLRHPLAAALVEAAAGKAAIARGRFTVARRRLDLALDLLSDDFPKLTADVLVDLCDLAILRGDGASAAVLADRALDTGTALDNAWLRSAGSLALARAAHLDGDLAGAGESCVRAVGLAGHGGYPLGLAAALEMLCVLKVEQSDHEVAARVFGAVAAMRRRLGAARRTVEARTVRTALAQLENRLGHDSAAQLWREGARLDIDEASSQALRGHRVTRARPDRGWQSLTPAELAVAELVAKGLHNADIAARLFVSPATVRSHLGHIFQKLEIRTRAQLAVQAAARRLTT